MNLITVALSNVTKSPISVCHVDRIQRLGRLWSNIKYLLNNTFIIIMQKAWFENTCVFDVP